MLLKSLEKARIAGIEAAKGDDGGSANMDSVFLRVPRAREEKVLETIQKAGLYCLHKSKMAWFVWLSHFSCRLWSG
jgi:hypothetical protein